MHPRTIPRLIEHNNCPSSLSDRVELAIIISMVHEKSEIIIIVIHTPLVNKMCVGDTCSHNITMGLLMIII
jgi:hypothetical protein